MSATEKNTTTSTILQTSPTLLHSNGSRDGFIAQQRERWRQRLIWNEHRTHGRCITSCPPPSV